MKKLSLSLLLSMGLLVSFNVCGLPVLSSLPTAASTIYLDFDGFEVTSAYWNGGNAFVCAPSGLNNQQITEVFSRVAEDFRPFNINITTDLSLYLAAPLSSRMRVVITPTSGWFPGAGGVSLTGSFTWGDDTPAFVFCDKLGPYSTKMIAECCSHESGHTLGLSHQSTYDGTCNLTATYNEGAGTGVNAWAPIMGNSYYRNMSGWNDGPTPYGCAETQDNLSTITTQNGFTFRPDDFSDDINKNAEPIYFSAGITPGIITTSTDKDAFTFTLYKNSSVGINIKPFSITESYEGANLDIKMLLYNSDKVLIRTYDPPAVMNIELDTTLHAGTYYMLIDGAGNSNIGDYGSLGSYTISTSAAETTTDRQLILTGRDANYKHSLSWVIPTGEPVKLVSLESSPDGIGFTALCIYTGITTSFAYTPRERRDLHYRVKAISKAGQVAYSNTVLLKAPGNSAAIFEVTTLIRSEITVKASEQYHYRVSDIKGNMLAVGKGEPGTAIINMYRHPAGIYVLQLINNDKKQTERIIKQ